MSGHRHRVRLRSLRRLAKQLPDGLTDVGLPHQRLADQHRIDTGRLQPTGVGPARDPAFADQQDLARNPFSHFHGPRQIDFKGFQVAIVDSDQDRVAGQHGRQIRGIVQFHQRGHARLQHTMVQFLQFAGGQTFCNQQHGIGSGCPRLEDLVRVQHKILAQQGQADRGANQWQKIQVPLKKMFLGQHADAGGAGGLVDFCNGDGIKVLPDDSCRGTGPFDFGNQADGLVVGEGLQKIPDRWSLFGILLQLLEGDAHPRGGDFATFACDNPFEDGGLIHSAEKFTLGGMGFFPAGQPVNSGELAQYYRFYWIFCRGLPRWMMAWTVRMHNTTESGQDRSHTFWPFLFMSRPAQHASRRYVDMWAMPGVHPSNNQFLQKLKSADTSQFTRNMQIVGTVSSHDDDTGKWDKTHLIGIRTDVWHPDQKEVNEALEVLQEKRREELRRQLRRTRKSSAVADEQLEQQIGEDDIMQLESGQLENRRLVLKLFKTTGSRTSWCGTLEQMTSSEIHTSIGSRRALITFAILLPRYQLVTTVQQNHRTWRIPPVFTFCFHINDQMHHLVLARRWVSFGPDYDVAVDGQRVGLINGRLFGFGSDSEIDLSGHPLVGHGGFMDLMTLFAASLGYHRALWRSIRRRVAACLAGQSCRHIIEDEELRLRQNGRSAA